MLTRELAEQADIVVTMGCGDECPFIPGKRYIDWELQDPQGRPVDEVRATRDEIARRVQQLLVKLHVCCLGLRVDLMIQQFQPTPSQHESA